MKDLNSWLNIDGSVDIQMPNEIFDDLNRIDFKNWKHKAIAYSYYYLINYIYRNALYGVANAETYSQENILSILVANYRKVLYVTKKNGLLDQIGYTKTTTDYPITFYMDDKFLEFGLIKELRKKVGDVKLDHSPRLQAKIPLKSFIRFDDEDYTGTYYSFQSTHLITIRQFAKIIENEKLGCFGLYLYGFIKTMSARYGESLNWSNKQFAEYVGCSDRTISKYLNELKNKGYIQTKRNMIGQDFCIGQIIVA